MKLRPLGTLLLAALLLGGCASSSGIQSHGADTYRVEGSSEFGLNLARERAFEEASGYCTTAGERVHEISSRASSSVDFLGDPIQTFELVFQCVGTGGGQPAGNPQATTLPPPPPTVIDQPDRTPPATELAAEQAAEQADWQHYEICGSGMYDVHTTRQACDAAIRSDRLPLAAASDSLFNRAILFAQLGQHAEAIADLDLLLSVVPDDRRAYEFRQNLAEAARPRTYHLYYEGLFCAGVPGDTIMHPAAELFLTTAVVPLDDPNAAVESVHPGTGSYYPNVSQGFTTRPHTRIWSGMRNRLHLTASLWEHDGGGAEVEAVGLLVFNLALAARGASTPATVPGSRLPVPRPGPKQPTGEPVGQEPGQFADALFGTGHDLLGVAIYEEFDVSYYANQPKRNYAGIRHHFATPHNKGGADCRAYFSVEAS